MSGLNRCCLGVNPSLTSLLQEQGPLSAGRPLRLARPLWRKVGSLGHVLGKWVGARSIAVRHLARDPRLAPLRRWQEVLGGSANIASGDGLYATLMEIQGDAAQVVEPLLSRSALERFIGLLPRFVKSRVPALAAPCLEVASEASAPGWMALLRLRPMQEFWDLVLRRSHVEVLRELLPEAWLLETGPLPPQAVVPRLELHDWDELGTISATGRCFELVDPLDGRTLLDADVTVAPSALTQVAALGVVQEKTHLPGSSLVLAIYHRHGRRVDMAACLRLERSEERWHVSWVRCRS